MQVRVAPLVIDTELSHYSRNWLAKLQIPPLSQGVAIPLQKALFQPLQFPELRLLDLAQPVLLDVQKCRQLLRSLFRQSRYSLDSKQVE